MESLRFVYEWTKKFARDYQQARAGDTMENV